MVLDGTVTSASRAYNFGMNCDANRLLFSGMIWQPPPTKLPHLFEMHSMVEKQKQGSSDDANKKKKHVKNVAKFYPQSWHNLLQL